MKKKIKEEQINTRNVTVENDINKRYTVKRNRETMHYGKTEEHGGRNTNKHGRGNNNKKRQKE